MRRGLRGLLGHPTEQVFENLIAVAIHHIVRFEDFTGQGRVRHGELTDTAAAAGIAVHEVSGEVMAELAQTVTPQGLLALCAVLAAGGAWCWRRAFQG